MNEKYIAGLIDADGCIRLHFNKRNDGTYRAAASVKVALVGNIKYLADEFDLNWREYPRDRFKDCEEVYVFGKRAITFLNRIKKHLRIKQHLAEWVIDNHGTVVDDPKPLKKDMRLVRRESANHDYGRHPARAWLAGYFDGDGCIAFHNRRGECWLQITGWSADRKILDVLSKCFGGKVYKHTGDSVCYKLYLSRNTASPFIEYMKKHVVIRRHQIDKYLHMTRND